MALDGIVLASLLHELRTALVGGRIDKIYQIEKEDLLVAVRNNSSTYKLLLTANSNYPRLHLTELAKNAATEPPMFCMMLRKHIGGGKILAITQPHFERIVELDIEATNEMGDKEVKKLIIEIMGRHSNIILTREEGTIIDSIKHISFDTSSVREVLPGRCYVYPPNQNKLNPLATTKEAFIEALKSKAVPLFKGLYLSYSGLSPAIAHEICLDAGCNEDELGETADAHTLSMLYKSFEQVLVHTQKNQFVPVLYCHEDELPFDFYAFELSLYSAYHQRIFPSMSKLLEHFYFEKSTRFNVSQKTGDIKKLVHTFIDRSVRKKQIQEKALEECKQKELYKIYGELLTAYSHQVPEKVTCFTTINYYQEPYEDITIPLDEKLTAIQNAQRYFKLYSKAKRTQVAASEQLIQIEEDLKYLDSVLLSLDFLETKEDILQLREELFTMGYIKKRKNGGKKMSVKKQLPYLQFTSSTGLPIYVGKNNFQNDQLTMKFAKNNDLWLHIKDGPGSHVIVRLEHLEEIDETSLLEAATLAAYYSSGKLSSHVPIDYTLKKYVKKVPNAKPGMVIYTNFKTLFVTPTEQAVKKLLSH
ncbi:Rqc2 family fibronectin-binding protein [Sporanaerobium hydrogeniformans]|uniref:Rqc2 family fibronectin-binding protein n=1 Tax=Sporanaerobium hydrogeniformans TaxID=3072179 RepID=UPI0015D473AC|nr:NFACT RNA binding domain-containing protein [Sporanaerobium hydrogeniformans]